MFTLDPGTPASRLICGLTWGGDGAWTSWPPHQHEKDLEEVYCYFDMPEPKSGFHISYLESGGLQEAVFHQVQSGTMVEAPMGYHPTVSTPGTRNAYLWVLVAFTPKSRRYDLAVTDPAIDRS
jgi:5-deoxy-glucuronate isomerase